jgi:hypothetical protein
LRGMLKTFKLTFEKSLTTSDTLESEKGLGSIDPVNAQSVDIAKLVFPLPLLQFSYTHMGPGELQSKNQSSKEPTQNITHLVDPPSLFVPRNNTKPLSFRGYETDS